MPTYDTSSKDVEKLAAALRTKSHQHLDVAKVAIGYLFAYAPKDKKGDPKGPAIKNHGYPAAALVKVTSHKDRVAGLPDAVIILDGDQWPEWSEERRGAVLDHELEHLKLKTDREGAVRSDDNGRPLLKVKPHDFQVGGFSAVIDRHGEQAVEAQALQDCAAVRPGHVPVGLRGRDRRRPAAVPARARAEGAP